MTSIDGLQTEIARWDQDLAALEEECTAEGWAEPEKLLFTLQQTVSTYRRKVLPRITADRALVLPALPAHEAPRAITAYGEIVADEIAQLVDRLEELQIELIRFGQTPQLQRQANETLAGLRALGRVVRRYENDLR